MHAIHAHARMHRNTTEAADRCQLHNHFMHNSASPCVGRLEALRQCRVVVDEDVWGAGGLQHLSTATSCEVGRGVREALVTVLTLPHAGCTVIWRGAKGLIK